MLGNTPVYLPIERLQVGDVVVSRNEHSGATEYKTIVGVTKKTAQTLVTLHLADAATGKEVQVVQATPEHPFRVFARGWVRAGQLGIGTSIVTRAGPALVVIAIEHQERAEGYSVYNLTVDQDHTYFVGAAQGGVWVHNTGDDCDETFITYSFQKDGKTVYIGKASGIGSPEYVLERRMIKGHSHWKPGYTRGVIDIQQSEDACAGAEGVWFHYHKTIGSKLTNKNTPLDFGRRDRRLASARKLEAYDAELQQRLQQH